MGSGGIRAIAVGATAAIAACVGVAPAVAATAGPSAGGALGPAVGPAAVAVGPRVALLVVDGTRSVEAPVAPTPARSVRVGRRACAVAAATPLAALLGAAGRVRLRDYGSCGPRPADGAGLFVTEVLGHANRGVDGWVYKVGRRVGTTGAADSSGPFGTGRRLHTGDRLLWFYCRSRGGGCQRTLEVRSAARRAMPGAPLAVTVMGYDDNGRGRAIPGATVTLAGPSGGQVGTATTDGAGRATLTAPAMAGRVTLVARRLGLVRSFPEAVTVG